MPAKRDPSLIPLSHDHHHGLVRAVRIKRAIRDCDDLTAERTTTCAYYTTALQPHFRAEEDAVIPALRDAKALPEDRITRLLAEHRTMESMVAELAEDRGDLAAFADLLERHIRFEEREIFVAYEEHVPAERRAEVEATVRRVLGPRAS